MLPPNLSDPSNNLMADSRGSHSDQTSTNTGSSELWAASQVVPLKSDKPDKSVSEGFFNDDELFMADKPKGPDNMDKPKRKRGRPKDRYTELIAKLKSREKNGRNGLKKSYIWAYVIRKLRRILRGGIPAWTLNCWEQQWWELIVELVLQHEPLFASISPTHQGTTSDCIGPRKHQHLPESQYRSHSIPYCKHFYAEAPVRQLHFYFIQLLFEAGRIDPEAISTKLKLRCCDGDHSDQCAETWTKIKDYLVKGMFTEFKLEPYIEEETCFERDQYEFLHGEQPFLALEEFSTNASTEHVEDIGYFLA